jgi:hypothetical protein
MAAPYPAGGDEGNMYRLDRCPQGRWELAQMRPQADLVGDVLRYAGYVERSGWSIDNREVAGPVVPLIISFGDPFRIRMGGNGPALHRSFLAGLYDGYADVASTGRAHCMQVDFTPLGAYRFFAMPMRDLAAQTVALDQVGRFEDLRDRLFEAPDWATRFALLDCFVRRRLAAADAPLLAGRLGLASACGERRPHQGIGARRRDRLEPQASGTAFCDRDRCRAKNRRPHPALCRRKARDRRRRPRRPHGLGGPRRRLGLCGPGPSDPRVPSHGGRDACRLCA